MSKVVAFMKDESRDRDRIWSDRRRHFGRDYRYRECYWFEPQQQFQYISDQLK